MSERRRCLKVGEAAELLGVCAETLRNWERKGKLIPIRHPINGYRLYRVEELERLFANTLYRPTSTRQNGDGVAE